MSIFACNACNYIFDSIDENVISCPKCRARIILSDIEGNRKVMRRAVRPATGSEISSYENAIRFEPLPHDLDSRIDRLSALELSDEEHNLGLVLLYYLNKVNDYSGKLTLETLLNPRNSYADKKIADNGCKIEYRMIIKNFTEDYEMERKNAGTNDVAVAAVTAGKESASATLMRFRSNKLKPNRKKPNLASIRELDPDPIALKPSFSFLEFLLDLYNSTGVSHIESYSYKMIE